MSHTLAARADMPATWIRLDPPPVEARAREGREHAPARAALHRIVGCRWIWWAPDSKTAWDSVLAALGVGMQNRVVGPVGMDPVVAQAVRGSGAAVVEVDLDPRSGSPLWQTAPARRPVAGDVYLVEHRHGRPSLLPPVEEGRIVLEHATDGVGGSVVGRPVGSLGAAAVFALGRPPFARSTGALVGTDDPARAASLAAVLSPLEIGARHAGRVWSEAAGVEDWVAGCRAAAQVYSSAWRGARLPVRPVDPAPGAEPSCSAYLAVVPEGDALIRVLASHGVEARRPVPPGLISLLAHAPCRSWRGARAFYREVIQLPNHPELGLGELLYVADAVGVYLRASQDEGAHGRDLRRSPELPTDTQTV